MMPDVHVFITPIFSALFGLFYNILIPVIIGTIAGLVSFLITKTARGAIWLTLISQTVWYLGWLLLLIVFRNSAAFRP